MDEKITRSTKHLENGNSNKNERSANDSAVHRRQCDEALRVEKSDGQVKSRVCLSIGINTIGLPTARPLEILTGVVGILRESAIEFKPRVRMVVDQRLNDACGHLTSGNETIGCIACCRPGPYIAAPKTRLTNNDDLGANIS